MSAILGVIFGRYNEILASLSGENPTFAPILERGDAGQWRAREWAEGFIDAMGLRPREWERLIMRKQSKAMLLPITISCANEEELRGMAIDPVADADLLAGSVDAIPDAVAMIDAFWKKREHGAAAGSERRSKAVGRNAPCPCGSGRKYKRCCGR